MADVMQPFVQQSSSMSMLQGRSPSSDGYQATAGVQSYQQAQRQPHALRSSFAAGQNPPLAHHRTTSTGPIQPYAFQSTPQLRTENRTSSAPVTATQKNNVGVPTDKAIRSTSKNELVDHSKSHPDINISSSVPDLTLNNFDMPSKSSPDRYRRSLAKKLDGPALDSTQSGGSPLGSGLASSMSSAPPIQRTLSDDVLNTKSSEAMKRYKRRSVATPEVLTTPTLTGAHPQRPSSSHTSPTPNVSSQQSTIRPVTSYHRRNTSNDSSGSIPTMPASNNRETRKQVSSSPVRNVRKDPSPSRASMASSSDAQRKLNNPSPLSRSAVETENVAGMAKQIGSPSKSANMASPAAQQLAALNDKDLNKGYKSRLRRAFSFGSAAELRKTGGSRPSGENFAPQRGVDGIDHDLNDEEQEVARRQEAAGIGAGIYSGQGGFSGSTDNLSISSTASSASIMLRKMGKGMKKGGRSLKGLFRPKSVIGVPAADGPLQPSLAEVSLVTVEAERQRVNLNLHPSDQNGGGTGFPMLNRNSADLPPSMIEPRSSAERTDSLRKSIVVSDKERAEVLAAVKKGILKRSGTASPSGSPTIRPQNNASFTDVPTTASPAGSLPGTPKDERKSRSMSSTTSSNDYFSQRQNLSTRSMPATPQSARNISFSPRLQFHDAWSATEYDRRGEVATCNRLTPMLAQQIKEELNTFKMEMEVHELSKPHTHFF